MGEWVLEDFLGICVGQIYESQLAQEASLALNFKTPTSLAIFQAFSNKKHFSTFRTHFSTRPPNSRSPTPSSVVSRWLPNAWRKRWAEELERINVFFFYMSLLTICRVFFFFFKEIFLGLLYKKLQNCCCCFVFWADFFFRLLILNLVNLDLSKCPETS